MRRCAAFLLPFTALSMKKNSNEYSKGYKQVERGTDGKLFKKGELVVRDDVRGEIIGITNTANFVLVRTSDGDEVKLKIDTLLRHWSERTKPEAKPEVDCAAEIKQKDKEIRRLMKSVEECNDEVKRKTKRPVASTMFDVPPAPSPVLVENAPEVKAEHIKEAVAVRMETITEAAAAGDAKTVKAETAAAIAEIKELGPTGGRTTHNISENCRVEKYVLGGKQTIRIYFHNPPSAETKADMKKQGFRYYTPSKTERYWGAYLNVKRLEFAENLCNGTSAPATSVGKKSKQPVDEMFNPDEPEADEQNYEDDESGSGEFEDDETDESKPDTILPDFSKMTTDELIEYAMKNLV